MKRSHLIGFINAQINGLHDVSNERFTAQSDELILLRCQLRLFAAEYVRSTKGRAICFDFRLYLALFCLIKGSAR